jgi:hypothetical protein
VRSVESRFGARAIASARYLSVYSKFKNNLRRASRIGNNLCASRTHTDYWTMGGS